MIRPTGSVVFWRRTLPVKAAGRSGFAGRHLRVRPAALSNPGATLQRGADIPAMNIAETVDRPVAVCGPVLIRGSGGQAPALTARMRMGAGRVVDIAREVKPGGPSGRSLWAAPLCGASGLVADRGGGGPMAQIARFAG